MARVLQVAQFLVLLAVIAFLGAIGWRAWVVLGRFDTSQAGVSSSVESIAAELKQNDSAITAAAVQLLNGANALIARVNDKNPKRNSVALLNEDLVNSRHLIEHADLAANDAREASDEELKALPSLTRQAEASIAGIQPVEKQAQVSIAEMQIATVDLEKVISNPDIPRTLTGTAGAAQHLDATAADVQQAVHAYTHPGWKTRLVNWTLKGVSAIGGWF
ncbi:MAG TPA: hypothetical protein VMI06_04440 [Terriglobia bacterium]|nr:hypothetical protein [Terriglobia bacterium]